MMGPSPVEELVFLDLERSTKGASKQRRDQINAQINMMRDLLPLAETARQRLSQLQIMSLSCVYIRKCNIMTRWFGTTNVPTDNPFDFFQALAGFLLITTRDGKLVYISENVTEYLGHSMVDMKTQGDSLFDIIDKRDHITVQAQLMRGGTDVAPGQPLAFFCRMNMSRSVKRQSGFGDVKTMHVRGHFVSVPDPERGGEQLVFASFCYPLITIDSKDTLLLSDTMIFKSAHRLDMTFLEISHSGEFHLGVSSEEMVSKSWYSILHPEDIWEGQTKHIQLIKSRHEMGCMLTVRMLVYGGQFIWVNIVMHVRQALANSDDPVVVCVNQVISEDEACQLRGPAYGYPTPCAAQLSPMDMLPPSAAYYPMMQQEELLTSHMQQFYDDPVTHAYALSMERERHHHHHQQQQPHPSAYGAPPNIYAKMTPVGSRCYTGSVVNVPSTSSGHPPPSLPPAPPLPMMDGAVACYQHVDPPSNSGNGASALNSNNSGNGNTSNTANIVSNNSNSNANNSNNSYSSNNSENKKTGSVGLQALKRKLNLGNQDIPAHECNPRKITRHMSPFNNKSNNNDGHLFLAAGGKLGSATTVGTYSGHLILGGGYHYTNSSSSSSSPPAGYPMSTADSSSSCMYGPTQCLTSTPYHNPVIPCEQNKLKQLDMKTLSYYLWHSPTEVDIKPQVSVLPEGILTPEPSPSSSPDLVFQNFLNISASLSVAGTTAIVADTDSGGVLDREDIALQPKQKRKMSISSGDEINCTAKDSEACVQHQHHQSNHRKQSSQSSHHPQRYLFQLHHQHTNQLDHPHSTGSGRNLSHHIHIKESSTANHISVIQNPFQQRRMGELPVIDPTTVESFFDEIATKRKQLSKMNLPSLKRKLPDLTVEELENILSASLSRSSTTFSQSSFDQRLSELALLSPEFFNTAKSLPLQVKTELNNVLSACRQLSTTNTSVTTSVSTSPASLTSPSPPLNTAETTTVFMLANKREVIKRECSLPCRHSNTPVSSANSPVFATDIDHTSRNDPTILPSYMNSPESMNDEESKSGHSTDVNIDKTDSENFSHDMMESPNWQENSPAEISSDIEEWLEQIIKPWQQSNGATRDNFDDLR